MTGPVSSSSGKVPQEDQIPQSKRSSQEQDPEIHKTIPDVQKEEIGRSDYFSESQDYCPSTVVTESLPWGSSLGKLKMRDVERGLQQEVSQKKYMDQKGMNSVRFSAESGPLSSFSQGINKSALADGTTESREAGNLVVPAAAVLRRQEAEPEEIDTVHAPIYPHKRARNALSSPDTLMGAAEQSIITQTDQAGDSTTFLFQTTFVDTLSLAEVEAAIHPGRTKVLFFETIANPTLIVANIPALATIAHRHSLQVVADNTFAGLVVSPAVHGADIIVHSISKFISGNSDIIAGVVCGPASLIHAMMDLHQGTLMLLGPTLNATVASVIAGRLPHLALRVREHSARALEFATRLQALGLAVIYPGLSTHPQHQLLSALANKSFGYGGLFCLDLGTKERAYDLMRYLQNGTQFGFMAVSLGYHDTLMSCSGASTSSELTQEEQATAGISPGLVRISIGYTGSVDQRWEQMLEALVALGLVSPSGGKSGEEQAAGLSDHISQESNKKVVGSTFKLTHFRDDA